MNDQTIRYYDEHAEEFTEGTIAADMHECRERFLAYLKPGQKILDAGCGSGRDVIAFRQAGYDVDAFDASEKLCRIASEKTGITVRQLRFEKLEGQEKYDGIWACASLLHVEKKILPDVMIRLHRLLKESGVLYVSFKHGSSEREKDGRYFCDFTEQALKKLMEEAAFEIKELFLTRDVREGRQDEAWVNAVAIKSRRTV